MMQRFAIVTVSMLCVLFLTGQSQAKWIETIVDAAMAGDDKALADIDGDGFLDIIAGGKRSENEPLTWYRYPSWQKYVIALPNNEFTTEMDVADMDGDGDSDLVVCDGPTGVNCRYYVNPRPGGDPRTTAAWTTRNIGSGNNWVHDLQTGDYNRDRRMDVITNRGLFTQQADGTFIKEAVAGNIFGDVDGDGDIDIVAASTWYENPGWVSHPGPGGGEKVRLADIDGDGRPDIVINSGDSVADLAWYSSNSPKTGAWIKHLVKPSVSGGHTLSIGDIDGDGDADILSAEMFGEVAVFLNNGHGGFTRQTVSYSGIHNGVLGDIDSDGDLDIMGCNYTGNPPLRLWQNTITTQPPPSRIPINPIYLLLRGD